LFISGIQENNYQKPELIFFVSTSCIQIGALRCIQIRLSAKVPAMTSATRQLNHFCTGSGIDWHDGALVAVVLLPFSDPKP
jgi:hypothetical protein